MGLLKPSDWKAKWIGIGYEEDTLKRESPSFRNAFKVNKKIKSATAFITSHGLYQAYLNGNKIGDAYLTPGWTSYNKGYSIRYMMSVICSRPAVMQWAHNWAAGGTGVHWRGKTTKTFMAQS